MCQVSSIQSEGIDYAMVVQQESKGSWDLAGGSPVIHKGQSYIQRLIIKLIASPLK